MKTFLSYLKPYRRQAVLAVLCIEAEAAFELVIPLVMAQIIDVPEAAENSRPSWFGFLITCNEGVDRNRLVQYVESRGVQTRMLFAGNLIKHPCFDNMRESGEGYRVVGSLQNTDRIMADAFWVGVYPGMTDEKIDYMAKVIKEGLNQ